MICFSFLLYSTTTVSCRSSCCCYHLGDVFQIISSLFSRLFPQLAKSNSLDFFSGFCFRGTDEFRAHNKVNMTERKRSGIRESSIRQPPRHTATFESRVIFAIFSVYTRFNIVQQTNQQPGNEAHKSSAEEIGFSCTRELLLSFNCGEGILDPSLTEMELPMENIYKKSSY